VTHLLLRVVLFPALVALCTSCASGSSSRPPRPQPPLSPAEITQFGFNEVLQWGKQYLLERGYEAELLEALPTGRTLWRLRFGLAPRGSGRLLELTFDTTGQRLVRAVELVEVPPSPRPAWDGGTQNLPDGQ
jgi:hypothetical protein